MKLDFVARKKILSQSNNRGLNLRYLYYNLETVAMHKKTTPQRPKCRGCLSNQTCQIFKKKILIQRFFGNSGIEPKKIIVYNLKSSIKTTEKTVAQPIFKRERG